MEQGFPNFCRRRVVLQTERKEDYFENSELVRKPILDNQTKPSVLVVNSSNVMAGAITKQLSITCPDCTLLYSPSLALAGWMLKKRKINLIIANEVLPDGGIDKLKTIVSGLEDPPDILVVGRSVHRSVLALTGAGYHMVKRKKLEIAASDINYSYKNPDKDTISLKNRLTSLGADLRNDLNNPLQEIVTMAYIAKQDSLSNTMTEEAIFAIEKAANQLAGTVSGLEQRIVRAVVDY